MEGLELVLLLLAVVAAVTLLAQKVRIPYPILMVIAGLGIALIPAVPTVELEPDTVLTRLPAADPLLRRVLPLARDLWRNIRPIALLAVGLVITTTIAVAVGGDCAWRPSSAGRSRSRSAPSSPRPTRSRPPRSPAA